MIYSISVGVINMNTTESICQLVINSRYVLVSNTNIKQRLYHPQGTRTIKQNSIAPAPRGEHLDSHLTVGAYKDMASPVSLREHSVEGDNHVGTLQFSNIGDGIMDGGHLTSIDEFTICAPNTRPRGINNYVSGWLEIWYETDTVPRLAELLEPQ